jgi:tetratricopeptide (TPR) repeat protein
MRDRLFLRLIISVILVSSFTSLRAQHRYPTVENLPETGKVSEGIELRSGWEESVRWETDLEESDILSCIQKWHGQVYDGETDISTPYMLAILLDPVIDKMVQAVKDTMATASSTAGRVEAMNAWLLKYMVHTQMHPRFKGYPGNDPWGLNYLFDSPTFKKLLPSEMAAMKLHTGKISGKCITLANLVTSLFVRMGVNEQDIVHLIMQMKNYRHGGALVRYEDEILLVNNNTVQVFRIPPGPEQQIPVIAAYTHRFFRDVSFSITMDRIDSDALRQEGKLFETFAGQMGIPEVVDNDAVPLPCDLNDPEDLKRAVFESTRRTRDLDLARYAYQSLYVKHPGYYLTASAQMSGPCQLSKNLKDSDAVFSWIQDHIRNGSIFPDGQERLMTADQVLVFQQGSAKDKAVLAYALLCHLGHDPEILLTAGGAYIRDGKRLIDASSGKDAGSVKGRVLFQLTAEERFPGLGEARRAAFKQAAGRDSTAILDAFRENAELFPEAWEVQEELGLVFQKFEDHEKALLYLGKANETGPAKASRLQALARLEILRRNAGEAAGYLEKAAGIRPWKPEIRAELVQALVFAGRVQEAAALYSENREKTIGGRPFRQILLDGLAEFRNRKVDHPDADRFIQSLINESD